MDLAPLALASAPAARYGRCRVLLAEDDGTNAFLAGEILRRGGYEVEFVTDGVQALAAVQARDYELVLMDCLMPNLDGRAATRMIRDWERRHARGRLPVIAVTASAMPHERLQCLEAGMDEVLTKPYLPHELEATLGRWLPQAISSMQA